VRAQTRLLGLVPDGQITLVSRIAMSSPISENFPLNPSGKSFVKQAPSSPARGALAIVTNVGAGCGGRGSTSDQRACSVRRSRVVLTPRCWRQIAQVHSCAETVARKPFTGGEHEVSRKATAQGRPECFRCMHIARETAGAARTRSSLRPLLWANVLQTSGAIRAAITRTHALSMS
jgi:hypothetical protein